MSNFVLTPNAVAKLRRAIAPRSGNTGAIAATGLPIDPDKFPPPFTVRWSASAYNGAGGWVIWLPDKSRLIYIGDAYQSSIQYIAQEPSLPTGWYKFSRISSSDTAVWMTVFIPQSSIAVQSAWFDSVPGSSSSAFNAVAILVATMSSDSTTGAKRVKQFVDSAVVVSKSDGSVGSVTLDDVSTDWNSGNQVQVKDWDTGTPVSSTTIAQDINSGNTTAQGTVVERTTGGVLKYKKPGTLAQLLGSSVSLSSQKILTGLSWDTTNHRLVISSATVNVANGVITSWTPNANENIETTAISSIIGS